METPLTETASVPPPQNKKLCVDMLNYARKFFYAFDGRWPPLETVYNKISKFVQAANKSGWDIEIFIDANIITDEAYVKWAERREKDVKDEHRDIPQGVHSLLGDMFKRNGVRVHYSLEADCDDTIVSYACAYNGCILSNDSDMFRYKGTTDSFLVYSAFTVTKKELILEVSPKNGMKAKKDREVISPPPKTSDKDPGFICLFKDATFLRGSPSPLTRKLGNLHHTVRPLRQAAYHRMGIKGNVKEQYPLWDHENDRCIWINEQVPPDPKLDKLLDAPNIAMQYFFSSAKQPKNIPVHLWQNHVFASRAVVYEIISCVTGEPLLTMLEKDGLFQPNKPKKQPLKMIFCIGCKNDFFLPAKEEQWFVEMGFDLPKRCPTCRGKKNKGSKKEDKSASSK